MTKSNLLRLLYVVIITILIFLIISTPRLIEEGVRAERILIGRELIQEALILILMLVSYSSYKYYRQQISRSRSMIEDLKKDKDALASQLGDSMKYIGEVNVQMQEMRSVMSSIKNYPVNEKDFKKALYFFCERVLGMINADWVIIRVINPDKAKTLKELSQARGNAVLLKHNISNKDIVGNKKVEGCIYVGSNQDNLAIKAYCVLSTDKISEDQEIFVKTILGQIEIMFLIATSKYYKEGYLRKIGKRPGSSSSSNLSS